MKLAQTARGVGAHAEEGVLLENESQDGNGLLYRRPDHGSKLPHGREATHHRRILSGLRRERLYGLPEYQIFLDDVARIEVHPRGPEAQGNIELLRALVIVDCNRSEERRVG